MTGPATASVASVPTSGQEVNSTGTETGHVVPGQRAKAEEVARSAVLVTVEHAAEGTLQNTGRGVLLTVERLLAHHAGTAPRTVGKVRWALQHIDYDTTATGAALLIKAALNDRRRL